MKDTLQQIGQPHCKFCLVSSRNDLIGQCLKNYLSRAPNFSTMLVLNKKKISSSGPHRLMLVQECLSFLMLLLFVRTRMLKIIIAKNCTSH